ncbi:biotin synthase BioB [Candidatus Berkiella aquae]|uniref:Biotin synthase n=1 Tax=Candidatus Berkiella aquae TaxID=295108 RepID=A0A0Q9YRH6_9GAMM|nr:biotin synthase BioB [Candidatus Berkiella aquae]MCS5709826.1 biotin synthase BioB [Candidatus Berkiella aquae]
MLTLRNNWTFAEAQQIYQQPFMDLVLQAQQIHRLSFAANTIQVCGIYNMKVGGCPEDCAWCGQSVYNETGVKNKPLANLETIVNQAKAAKASGATRLCLAASWRGPTERNLAEVLEMVKTIKSFGLEACITIGKLKPSQALALKEAGLDYYNHNLESSEEHFAKVSTTRQYQDRLDTLEHVRNAGINVCSGGILGMGETLEDRINLLLTLANLPEHPQSVPINQLVPIAGTPLQNAEKVDEFDFIRAIALARILMPKAYVRLSGGRVQMSNTMQALCFMAGANSIHHSENLLVTPNVDMAKDTDLFQMLGIQAEPPSAAAKTIPCQVIHS